MKLRFLLVPTVTLSALLLSLGSAAQTRTEIINMPPVISVSGSATVRVKPDEIFLTIGVHSRGSVLEEATNDSTRRIQDALQILKKYGVPESNIQVNFIQVEPLHDGLDRSRTAPLAYASRKSLNVRVVEIPKFDPMLAELFAAGVNQVENIEYRNSDMRRHRDKARELAVTAAREKADALAGQLGVRRGKPVKISEEGATNAWAWRGGSRQSQFQNVMVNSPAAATGGDDGGPALGQISITAQIYVDFLID